MIINKMQKWFDTWQGYASQFFLIPNWLSSSFSPILLPVKYLLSYIIKAKMAKISLNLFDKGLSKKNKQAHDRLIVSSSACNPTHFCYDNSEINLKKNLRSGQISNKFK